MTRQRIALVSSPYLGWGSIRLRFEHAFGADAEVDFLSLPWEGRARFWNGVYKRTGRLQSVYFSLAAREACNAAIAQGYDRILVTTNAQAALLPKRRGVRYAVYGDSTLKQLYEMQTGKPFRRRPGLPMRCFGEDTIHLCMSEWYASALVTEYGASQARIHIAPAALDVTKWSPTATKRTPPIVLFVARWFEQKGGMTLRTIAAMPEFREVAFVYITSKALEPGANERFLTGVRPEDPELIALMREAAVLALPTSMDCSPIVVVEAAASGTPAVVSGVGGVPELVEDGVTGRVVREVTPEAFAQALLPYLRQPELSLEQGAAARRRAEQVHNLRKQVALIKQVLS